VFQLKNSYILITAQVVPIEMCLAVCYPFDAGLDAIYGHLILHGPLACLHCMIIHTCKCAVNLNPLHPGQ